MGGSHTLKFGALEVTIGDTFLTGEEMSLRATGQKFNFRIPIYGPNAQAWCEHSFQQLDLSPTEVLECLRVQTPLAITDNLFPHSIDRRCL